MTDEKGTTVTLDADLEVLASVYRLLKSVNNEDHLRALLFWNLDKLGFRGAARVVTTERREVRDDA